MPLALRSNSVHPSSVSKQRARDSSLTSNEILQSSCGDRTEFGYIGEVLQVN